VQQTEVVCMKVTGIQVVVTDENCDPSIRPTGRTVTCNNTPCPPAYDISQMFLFFITITIIIIIIKRRRTLYA